MFADGNDTFLAALAECADETDFAVDVAPVERDQLADPESRTVKNLKDRPVTESTIGIGLGLIEESHDFLDRQEVGQRSGNLGGIEFQKSTTPLETVFPLKESKVTPDRGQFSGDGRAGVSTLTKMGQPPADFLCAGIHQLREFFCLEEILKLFQILAICTQGFRAQIAFRLKVLEEGFHNLHQSSQPEGISLGHDPMKSGKKFEVDPEG